MSGNQRYATARAFRQALEARLQERTQDSGLVVERLRKQVAFDRFLARIFRAESGAQQWALKGGYALELHLRQSRATKDIDLTIGPAGMPIAATVEQQRLSLRDEIRKLVSQPMADFFEFLIGFATLDLEGAPDGGYRFPVEASMDGRRFARFHVDIGLGDPPNLPWEILDGGDWLEFAGIPRPQFHAISREQHWAEKLHAYTRPRQQRANSRTKDLVDLVLLINLGSLSVARLWDCLSATFEKRASHPLPDSIPLPPPEWKPVFARLATESGIDIDMAKAFEALSAFWASLQPRL